MRIVQEKCDFSKGILEYTEQWYTEIVTLILSSFVVRTNKKLKPFETFLEEIFFVLEDFWESEK